MKDAVDEKAGQSENSPVEYRKRNGVWLRFFLFFSGFCLLLFLFYKTGWYNIFLHREQAQLFLESLGPVKFLGFIFLQVTQVVFAPVPGEVTGILGGYFFGIPIGIMLSTIGLTIGSFIAFSLSRAFGRPLVEKLVDQSILNRFDYVLQHKGIFVVFMLFLLPGFPKDYLCFILGLGHLTRLEFLVVSTVGRLFGTVLLTLGGGYIRCEEYGKLYILIAVGIAVTLAALFFRNRIEGLLKSLHAKKHNI